MNRSVPENIFLPLNLPPANLKLCRRKDVVYVLDILRKKNVKLTPEEYVRQTFVNWLINSLGYPKSLIANEIGITLNGTMKRCDSVVFGPDGNPTMIIEFKAPNIPLNQNVFDQIVRYNSALFTKLLVVSNGYKHFCCRIDPSNSSYQFLPEIPTYDALKTL